MSADVIDWELAAGVGRRLTPRGPELPPEQAHDAVAELRDLARFAVGPVRECTGLVADDTDAITVVVDRDAWVASNIAGFRVLLEPLLDRMRERRDGAVATVGSRVTAVQLGGVLAFLSGKVLGQYEVFTRAEGTPGRLLLVAPNIVAAERELGVDPHDFRLWVCLHEVTHRVQFAAVPWLRGHVVARSGVLAAADDDRRRGPARGSAAGDAARSVAAVRGTTGGPRCWKPCRRRRSARSSTG